MVVNFAQCSTSPQRLKQIFQTIDADSCPKHFNFHMHTVHSDGKFQPEVLLKSAIALGLKGLAITDHHTIAGYQAAQNWLKDREPEENAPELWSGIEVNAALLGIEVHILGYAFDPQHSSLKPYTQRHAAKGNDYQAASVIAAIQQAGGIAVLAHPARYK